MRVLIISLAYLPFIGGAELAVKDITERISDIEFSARGGPAFVWDMVTANLDGRQKEREKIGNINVYRVGKGPLAKYFFPFSAIKKAEALHQENRYDAIWAIMANQAGLVALKFKQKHPEVKYLLTLQEGDSLLRIWSRTWFMRPTYKNIYRRADCIQSISSFLARRAKKYGYQGKLEIIPNGVDLANFKKDFSAEYQAELRQKLGISPGEKVVTTISRLAHKNGIDILIKAVKDLPVKVLVIGCGKLEIKLKALAQELGVRDKILFLGFKPQTDLPQYLKISQAFVRTSRSEGLGSAFLEAMAAGVPVIGSKVGGIPDFLREGENGLYAEVRNPSDLAAKIQLLLSDESLRKKLIDNGRTFVSQSYDWQVIARKMAAILMTL